MSTVKKEIYIEASSEKVWDALKDLGAISNFHPFVPVSYNESDHTGGDGAARICEMPGMGMNIRETVVDWQEGESYTVAVTPIKGMAPVQNARGKIGVRKSGAGSTGYMIMDYEPRFGFIGGIMNKLMIRKKYSEIVADVLRGLKHHVETGDLVDEAVVKQLQAVPVTA